MSVNKEAAKKLMLEFTGNAAEEEIDAVLEQAGIRQRKIDDEKLIKREGVDESAGENTAEKDKAAEVNPTALAEEVPNDDALDELVIDESLINEIVEMTTKKVIEIMDKALEPIRKINEDIRRELDEVKAFVIRANGFIEDATKQREITEKRLNAIEKGENEKVRDALKDIPAAKNRQVVVTHRPTGRDSDGEGSQNAVVDLNEIAKATLKNVGVDLENLRKK
jgi:hypothetical protein